LLIKHKHIVSRTKVLAAAVVVICFAIYTIVHAETDEYVSSPDITYSELLMLTQDLKGTLTISDKIRVTATYYGVDVDTALNIACAESQFVETAKNPHSTASGVYQWLDSSWELYGRMYWGSLEGRDKLNGDDSIELAIRTMRDYGTSDWNASKYEGVGGGWSKNPIANGYCQ
jgi:hypothetical protein